MTTAGNGSGRSFWGMSDPPRLRSITGVRIHQLTLPESVPLASKLVSADNEQTSGPPVEGYTLGEPSRLHSSPQKANFAIDEEPTTVRSPGIPGAQLGRARSTSTSTFVPSSPPVHTRPRTTRPRAPTLAGEALEHEKAGLEHRRASVDEEVAEVRIRQLARCFIALKLPKRTHDGQQTGSGSRQEFAAEKGQGKEETEVGVNVTRPTAPRVDIANTPKRSQSTSSDLSPDSPLSKRRPPLSASASRASLNLDGTTEVDSPSRRRTASSASTHLHSSSALVNGDMGDVSGSVRPSLARTPSKLGTRPPRLVRSGSEAGIARPTHRVSVSQKHPLHRSPLLNGTDESQQRDVKDQSSSQSPKMDSGVPFYISPIHPPSTHPRFPALTPPSDFAAWMSTTELASHLLEWQVYYEDANQGWRKCPNLAGLIDLRMLRPVEKDTELQDNELLLNLAHDSWNLYHVPATVYDGQSGSSPSLDVPEKESRQSTDRTSVKNIIERSVRETRMKNGATIGMLHQLVNMQSVVADTKRSVEDLHGKINQLLIADADGRNLRRDVAQRKARIKWIQDKVRNIQQLSKEVEAQIILRRKALSSRQDYLTRAEEHDEIRLSNAHHLKHDIQAVHTERLALLPTIHHYRAHHVQALDALFPITPLNPSILLYSILDVPLPIPSGAKDPAPPLTLPPADLPEGVRIDERTTAAALGYVALAVQVLAGLGGTASGGLVYPVTYAGSRSLVKDVVSVMSGHRSFPLYTKGVERYRFDYAVFLLNMNIEMLMQEANIRLVDRRHTLPNLKALLLTLSSPTPPPPLPPTFPSYATSGTSTYYNSRAASRQTSHQWPAPPFSPSISSRAGSPPLSARGSSVSRFAHINQTDNSPSKAQILGFRDRILPGSLPTRARSKQSASAGGGGIANGDQRLLETQGMEPTNEDAEKNDVAVWAG